MRICARTIAKLVNSVGPLTLTVDSYPTSESPFDSSGRGLAQFLRSPQRGNTVAGYDSDAALSKAFKRVFAVAPREYR
jgi:hypothetical protein